jgi:hypothetical protein
MCCLKCLGFIVLSAGHAGCRANEYNAKVVNFMITHYWLDFNFDGKVDAYCHKVDWGLGEAAEQPC